MIRTQIYLPKSLKDHYQNLAKKRGNTLAGEIRQALEELKQSRASAKPKRDAKTNAGEVLLAIAKEINKLPTTEKVPTDLSINMDKYLYDDE